MVWKKGENNFKIELDLFKFAFLVISLEKLSQKLIALVGRGNIIWPERKKILKNWFLNFRRQDYFQDYFFLKVFIIIGNLEPFCTFSSFFFENFYISDFFLFFLTLFYGIYLVIKQIFFVFFCIFWICSRKIKKKIPKSL